MAGGSEVVVIVVGVADADWVIEPGVAVCWAGECIDE